MKNSKSILLVVTIIAVVLIIIFYLMNKDKAIPQPFIRVDTEQPVKIKDPQQKHQQEEENDDSNGPTSATRIIFYEGNGCSQEIVQTIEGENFDGRAYRNDEARSVKLVQVPRGTVIKVYDSPDGKEDDDFAIIEVKKKTFEYCIRSFEESIYSDNIEMVYNKKNGLDGKISRIVVTFP